MAQATLGTSSKVGMVMPLRWYFQRGQQQQAPQGEQLPEQQQPTPPPASSDEPPARPAVAATLATTPRDESGGGFNKSRASLRERADAGVVDNAVDFGKAVLQGPAGPLGAMSFMGRLFGGKFLPGGVPGSTVNNANLDPATAAKMKAAADAAAASPQQPPAAATMFKAGQDYLRNKKAAVTTSGAGGAGVRSGGAIGSNAGRRGF